MARINVYRTYSFIDKDPVIDQIRTMLQEEKLMKEMGTVEMLSGVSQATLRNWFYGDTKRPQFATVAAVSSSLGYEFGIKKMKPIDVEKELAAAARWYERQAEKAKNGSAKRAAAKAAKIEKKTSS